MSEIRIRLSSRVAAISATRVNPAPCQPRVRAPLRMFQNSTVFIFPPSLPFVRFFYSPRGGVRRGYSFTLSPIGEGCTFFLPEEKNGGVLFSAAVDKRIDSLASLAPVCVMRRFGAVSPMGPHSVPVGDFLLSPLMHSGPRCFQPDL